MKWKGTRKSWSPFALERGGITLYHSLHFSPLASLWLCLTPLWTFLASED